MAAVNKMKRCRRVGTDLEYFSNKAKKCLEHRISHRPGMHQNLRRKDSNYGLQLKAKQTIRFYYNVSEKQFFSCFKEADRRKGSTALNLFQILESRLDNVVYRMGFAATRAEARQLVSHRAILVNGSRVNVPSYAVKPGDVISVTEKAKKQERIANALMLAAQRNHVLPWINVDAEKFTGTFDALPTDDDKPSFFELNMVVEFYSK